VVLTHRHADHAVHAHAADAAVLAGRGPPRLGRARARELELLDRRALARGLLRVEACAPAEWIARS
jgi:hypothetical protein